MSVARHSPMSVEEFLHWENQQEVRYEFDGIAVQAMTGGTRAHGTIQANLIGSLFGRLRGSPCQAFGSHLKIVVAGSVRYPDAFITCTGGDNRATVADEPVVVFEIISESTARIDRIHKHDEYRDTPSIQRYVILEQDEVAAEVFTRAGADWAGRVQRAGSTLRLPEAGIDLPLDELYDRLGLTQA